MLIAVIGLADNLVSLVMLKEVPHRHHHGAEEAPDPMIPTPITAMTANTTLICGPPTSTCWPTR